MTTPTAERPSAGATASVVGCLLCACVAFQFNASMLAPALPDIGSRLGVDEAAVGLTQAAFFSSAAVFALVLPRISDHYGRGPVLGATLAVSAVGSVLGMLAVNVPMLAIGRALQGLTGPVVALCMLALRDLTPDPKRLGLLCGLVAATNGGIAGVDTIISGFLTDLAGFRPVFAVMAVASALASVWAFLGAPKTRAEVDGTPDWRGMLLVTVACVAGYGAIVQAIRIDGGGGIPASVLGVAAMLSMAYFVRTQLRAPSPLIPPRELLRRSSWALLLTTVATLAGVFAVVNGLLVTLVSGPTAGFELSAEQVSLTLLTPYALIGWAVGPVAGALAPKLGRVRVLRIALLLTAGGLGVLVWGAAVSSLLLLMVGVLILGVCYAGCANIMLNTLAVTSPDVRVPGFLAGAVVSAFHLGAAASFVVLPTAAGAAEEPSTAFAVGTTVGASLVIVAFIASWWVPAGSATPGDPTPKASVGGREALG